MHRKFLCLIIAQLLLISFSDLSARNCHPKPLNFNFTFNDSTEGWVGDFADYPVGEEEFYELQFAWTYLQKPIPLANKTLIKGLFLSGNNHSDDLFMFVKRQIKGLKPNTLYALTYRVSLEDDILPCQLGVGGAPGENVYLKVGASQIEPEKVDVDGFYLLNVDKGFQEKSGKNAITIGDLSNIFASSTIIPEFWPIGYTNVSPLQIMSDNKGHIWLFVGTDSGFESTTSYYIAQIQVKAQVVK